MSSLHRAARIGDDTQIADCLAVGEDINAFSVRGFTPLMIAAMEGRLSSVQHLLGAGADVRLTHRNGRTALSFAVGQGNLDVIRELIQQGADINAASRRGDTVAIEAARFNRREIVTLLAEHGADVHFKDESGRSAEDWLAQGGLFTEANEAFEKMRESPESRKSRGDVIRRLMASGLSPEEYAATHGRTVAWSYGQDNLDTPEAEAWAKRVYEITRSPAMLEDFEEKYLVGDNLADARTCRTRRARSAERRNRKR